MFVFLSENVQFPLHVNTISSAALQSSQPFKKTVPEINYLYEKDLHDNTKAGGVLLN